VVKSKAGAPGTTTVHFEAVGAGSEPPVMLLEAPDETGNADGISMTMVTVL
jgi:hypothetical protein